MYKISWALLCKRAIVEQSTNVLSIIDIVDDLSVDGASFTSNDNKIITPDLTLVANWLRDVSIQHSEELKVQISATGPMKKPFLTPFELTLHMTSEQRHRLIITIAPQVLDQGLGIYNFEIRSLSKNGRWHREAILPISVQTAP